MKKLLAIMCAVIVMVSVVTIASGSQKTMAAEGEQMPEQYNLGFVTLSTAGSFFGNVYGIVNELCDLTGAVLVSDVGAISPEEQITSVKNVISAGANAVIFINFTEDCLPKIADLCEENQVYWGQYARNVDNPEIKEYLDNSKYYIGRIYNDDSFIAQKALESFQENGVTKVGIVGPATGDTATDLRDHYFQDHAAEYGIEVVAVVRDLTDAASATDAVSNIIATNSDLGGIYCISGSDSRGEGVMNAIDILGANDQVKVVMSDFFDGMDAYFDNGTIISSFGGSYPDVVFLTVLLLNQISGTPLGNTEGESIVLELPYVQVNDSEELNEYLSYCESGTDYAYNAEEMSKMIGYYNPDITLDDIKEIMANYSLADVKARHDNQ